MDAYNEEAELDRYVWDYHSDLLSEFELRVQRAHRTELKAAVASESMARVLRKRWGVEGDDEVGAALANGWVAFRSAARARVLRDHADDLVINRCPVCRCVVKTPRARQCLWCGHDWHDR